MGKKVVLEEEQYVETLDRIIERDFFPDLPALRKQNQILHSDGLTRSTTADSVLTTAPRNAHERLRVPVSATRSESSSWDQPTPGREPMENAHGEIERNELEDEVTRVDEMTLNRFVATHTSEDNAAFTELQEKAIKDHKRRYHWAYDDDGSKGSAKLHLLTNDQWISKEQRQIVDEVLAPKGPTDDRPTAPDTWPFRARNALLFVPDLESSKQICKVKDTDNVLLLENGDRKDGVPSQALVKREETSGGVHARGKRETVYANSRFQAQGNEATEASTVGVPPRQNEMDLVQMTPLINPGVNATPLMTWGDIEGTPMILDAATTPDQILNGPRFVVKDSSKREKVANRLESQTRLRKSHSRQLTPTPLISRGKRPSETVTPSRATSIRSRLSSIRSAQRTPLLGADSELRASYATPLLPPRHSNSKPVKK